MRDSALILMLPLCHGATASKITARCMFSSMRFSAQPVVTRIQSKWRRFRNTLYCEYVFLYNQPASWHNAQIPLDHHTTGDWRLSSTDGSARALLIEDLASFGACENSQVQYSNCVVKPFAHAYLCLHAFKNIWLAHGGSTLCQVYCCPCLVCLNQLVKAMDNQHDSM